MALDMLIREAEGMSDDAIMEVVHYMQFIKVAAVKQQEVKPASGTGGKKKVLRRAGKRRGQIRMAEDFDAPLEEFKEYM